MKKETAPLVDSGLREGFFFRGNHVALDFLNTRPVIDGEPTELLPDFDAWLRWLRTAGLIEKQDAIQARRCWTVVGRKPHMAATVRGFREALRKDILSWEQGGAPSPRIVKRLNWILDKHPMGTRLAPRGNGLEIERWCTVETPNGLFGPLAHWIVDLFVHVDHRRVRKCGNCVLYFYDDSKKNARRWCSMELCGNRHKVAAYQKRLRSED